MRHTFNLMTKLRAIEMAEETGNKRKTARIFKVDPAQIRRWLKNKEKIREIALQNPRKLTVHSGPKLQHLELENIIYSWILEQREEEMPVSTADIIDRAVYLQPDFKHGDEKKRIYWVYEFLKRRHLSVRTRTRVSQITNAAMQPVKRDFCRRIMTSYQSKIRDPKYLVNMDETAVYLNCTPNRTVHPTGEKTVAIMIGRSNPTRITVAVSVAMDGSKLPLFVIFRGKPGGRVEKSLQEIVPDGIVGCVQRKGWMDNTTMNIWYNKVYRPYIFDCTGESGLLLDDFKVHKNPDISELMSQDNANQYMIPPHYTGLLQPCDVGINKSLKERLKKKAANWRREKHNLLLPGEKLPCPKRKDVLIWLKEIWDEFPVEIVKNSFTGSGYYFEDGIDYSGETESESDSDD